MAQTLRVSLRATIGEYGDIFTMGKHHPKLLNNLEVIRRQAGLTQAELSKFAGVSRKSINAVENGMYVPSTVLALKIADSLGCSVEDLFRLPSN